MASIFWDVGRLDGDPKAREEVPEHGPLLEDWPGRIDHADYQAAFSMCLQK